MKAWYLLYCKPRNEIRAKQNLELQGVETYLPLISESKKQRSGKIQNTQVPLFPNYLFINFNPQEFPVSRIHSTRGVNQIVGVKEDMLPLDPELITRIKIKLAELSNSEPETSEDIKKGDKVRFSEGPFAEVEGIFDEASGEKRCFVLLNILGKMKRVNVASEMVEKVTV
ncbi:transcription/translation regulatory transformer protein RfaH [Shewanella sp. 202IG2-18]|uniref:transcription/translation regulatory transformer protein RfaH n=1 Tax=Parashewanella hymeniacidonis TaxID=2807618 RepID=UPI00196085AC|nr:transcription/translation regulatory transformer protein RfaH [Parashewanella hymeniacidonis]MBM7072089.1 transcription/translation regulatory transformer protein RfaH [Parashewanella hymeniacidonis]